MRISTGILFLHMVRLIQTNLNQIDVNISKQASILELLHGNVVMLTNTRFLKSIKKQMSYNHNFPWR